MHALRFSTQINRLRKYTIMPQLEKRRKYTPMLAIEDHSLAPATLIGSPLIQQGTKNLGCHTTLWHDKARQVSTNNKKKYISL